jgi:hypothetical protein
MSRLFSVPNLDLRGSQLALLTLALTALRLVHACCVFMSRVAVVVAMVPTCCARLLSDLSVQTACDKEATSTDGRLCAFHARQCIGERYFPSLEFRGGQIRG